MIVDINKAAQESAKRGGQLSGGPKRAPLQHQASLSASASAAVGEAGKFIANKLSNEVNLKGAKEMMLAAANHLTGGGPPNSRIKFKNLEGDEDEDEFEEEEEDEKEMDSTMDDEDEDSHLNRKQRHRRSKRGQSVISAAISSYKQKQKSKGGYKKAAYEDDFEDETNEDEEDEDEDEDEKVNLNRSASCKSKKKADEQVSANNEPGSSTDERQTPTQSLSPDERRSSAKRTLKSSSKRIGKSRARYEEDELDDDFDRESGRTYKCLDNSVSLLIKTRFEETILRIALVAVVFAAIGIFILFSLPPAAPPSDVVDILIRNK